MTRYKKFLLLAAPLLTAVAAAPATAADLGAGFGVNGGATLVSDYRFRGLSQTNRRFAVQGTFTISHSSGAYATWWGSSIDDYVANGSDAENDFIIGYKKTLGSTTLDGGVLYYYYPGSGGISCVPLSGRSPACTGHRTRLAGCRVCRGSPCPARGRGPVAPRGVLRTGPRGGNDASVAPRLDAAQAARASAVPDCLQVAREAARGPGSSGPQPGDGA